MVEGRPRQACPACARVAWENPVPAAGVIIRHEREVVLCRRGIEPFRGSWGIPAGYQEVDETIETTAVREAREETGLIVRLTGLLDVLTTLDDPRKTSLIVLYSGEAVDGELQPGDDAEEAAWHSLDELPDDLGFANDRRVLERLRDRSPRVYS